MPANADIASDDDLIDATIRGAPDAFDALVERWWDRAIRFAWRMLGDQRDAEDAVQESFLRAYRALSRYEARGRFGSWFFQILANECRAAGARAARHAHADLAEASTMVASDSTEAPDAARLADIERAIADLDPLLREAFLLRYVEDFSYAQMTNLTGSRESTLRMRVKRARHRLRALLQEVHNE